MQDKTTKIATTSANQVLVGDGASRNPRDSLPPLPPSLPVERGPKARGKAVREPRMVLQPAQSGHCWDAHCNWSHKCRADIGDLTYQLAWPLGSLCVTRPFRHYMFQPLVLFIRYRPTGVRCLGKWLQDYAIKSINFIVRWQFLCTPLLQWRDIASHLDISWYLFRRDVFRRSGKRTEHDRLV